MRPQTDPFVVNPEMVTLARESRGLTQSELASQLDISQAKLSKIEAGASEVADELVKRLSKKLHYPPHFFARSDPIIGPGASEFFHRRRASLGSKLLTRIHAQVNIRRMEIRRLLQSVEIPENNIPRYDPETFDGSIEAIARAVRASWHLPPGPVKNLTQAIEDAGGIVILMELGTPLIDALSRYMPGLPPLFFCNADVPGDRLRMSLAHELGHAVMHHAPIPEMEEQAFRFAREFLMPEDEIVPQLHGLTLARLAQLKPYWRVSMNGLIKQAEATGAVTPNQARYLYQQMSRHGYRKSEPAELDIPQEQPSTLQDIVRLHRVHFDYAIEELATLVGLEEREMQTIYGIDPSPSESKARIRLVRDNATA